MNKTLWTIERTRYPTRKSAYHGSVSSRTWGAIWSIWAGIQAGNGYRYRLKRNGLVVARKV